MATRLSSTSRWQIDLAVAIMLTFMISVSASAQTYAVLHTFTGGIDGGTPYGGLTWDGGSNFYGTAAQGGYTGTRCYDVYFSYAHGCGTVFRLRRSGSNYAFSTLYEFKGGSVDGNFSTAAVTIARDGTLYGTTWGGHYQGQRGCEGYGSDFPYGCGIVFNLKPPSTACTTALCFWQETIAYAFQGTNESGGAGPGFGALIFDQAGSLYGTTWNAPDNRERYFNWFHLVETGRPENST